MKVIFDGEGIFVEYEEKTVKVGNDKLIHKKESYTRLWWKLKEAVKGKKVRIVVYEIE
ncbi:hypothetical protein [Palaeococcus sp. (in: euryarchaeotes)]|uniref:hypothetical protein n=1 Tax=Palaeococcus sp. (in: euryarchaeotes) TaxID=2820298 RepID=UPI0025F70866|nr:hypothetical protein [Palaeococcus sp. (in: euryarchaeotes)]MCD6558299.1 hypothetical protein [Palaeococcus sp. (in: euryarchaeotes)]